MPDSVRNSGFTKLNFNYLLRMATRPKQSHYYIIYHAGQGWRAHQEVQLVPLESLAPGGEHAEEGPGVTGGRCRGGCGECGTIGQLERGPLTAALGWSRSTLIKWRPSTVRRSAPYCNSVSPEVHTTSGLRSCSSGRLVFWNNINEVPAYESCLLCET